tara:strand:- start:947 stop:1615 length:669 start_codon:yes stop_codon:yes gene_type:complete
MDEIKVNGLGATNPLIEMDAIRCFETLYKIFIESYEAEDLTEPNNKSEWDLMNALQTHFHNQSAKAGTNLNFRHGQTYLTSEHYKALSYAQRSPEYLSNIYDLSDFLYRKKIIKNINEVISQFNQINHFFTQPKKALVIEIKINSLDSESLKTENGECAIQSIKSIKKRIVEIEEYEKIPKLERYVENISEPRLNQYTFQLNGIIQLKDLKFEIKDNITYLF